MQLEPILKTDNTIKGKEYKRMKKYITPEMTVEMLLVEDIIATSGLKEDQTPEEEV